MESRKAKLLNHEVSLYPNKVYMMGGVTPYNASFEPPKKCGAISEKVGFGVPCKNFMGCQSQSNLVFYPFYCGEFC